MAVPFDVDQLELDQSEADSLNKWTSYVMVSTEYIYTNTYTYICCETISEREKDSSSNSCVVS